MDFEQTALRIELTAPGNVAAHPYLVIERGAMVHAPTGELLVPRDVAGDRLVIRVPDLVGAMRFLSSPSCLMRAAA